MTARTVIELIDDLDGTPATQTVTFALDGVTYDIDLSDDNATRLRQALATYTAHARRTGGRHTTPKTATGPDHHAVRAWAADQGLPVSARGRIPREIIDAYNTAH